MPRNCLEETLNIAVIKKLSESHFRKIIINSSDGSRSHRNVFFLTVGAKQKKRIKLISAKQNSVLLKTREFFLFGSWSLVVYLHVWLKPKFFPI